MDRRGPNGEDKSSSHTDSHSDSNETDPVYPYRLQQGNAPRLYHLQRQDANIIDDQASSSTRGGIDSANHISGLSDSLLPYSDSDDLQRVKLKLEYFFLDPLQKWRRKQTKPWKLLVQILKIFLFTSQLVLFGFDMAKFITYKDEMQTTLKQLLLKDWDPSADALAYPGPYVPYAAYTKTDFFHVLNHAIRTYSNISDLSVGPFGYQSNSPKVLSPIELCTFDYLNAQFEPSSFYYNYSMETVIDCVTLADLPPAGSVDWINFDIRKRMKKTINFSTMISTHLKLPLRTIIIEDASSGDAGIACFNMLVVITFENSHRDGQIVIELDSNPTRATCTGRVTSVMGSLLTRRYLNATVMAFCVISFVLCTRSLYRAFALMRSTNKILKRKGKILEPSDKLEFVDAWLLLILLNDVLVGTSTMVLSSYEERLLETDSYTICSLLLGIGNFLSWTGLLRYLSFFKKYNLLLVTLRKSFVHVLRFMLCTFLIYCGFCFCGWVVFGPYHFKFRQLSTTTECLFSLLNGDDMFETFALLRSKISSIWWFSRIYLYSFVSLFIYVVLSLFIALIMDAYEIIKEYSDRGFPKTRLQLFYLEGDLSKLAAAR